MAEKLKEKFGIEAKLIASSGGVFEVRAAEKLLFSKKGLGRFPDDGEVEKLVQGEVE